MSAKRIMRSFVPSKKKPVKRYKTDFERRWIGPDSFLGYFLTMAWLDE